jgi:hypothetical protein
LDNGTDRWVSGWACPGILPFSVTTFPAPSSLGPRLSAALQPFLLASRSPRIKAIVVGSALIGLLIGINTTLLHLRLDPLGDVRAYYDAGARLNAGLPLYEQPSTTNDAGFYRYPPLLAIFFRPLALLPYETAAIIWEAMLLIAFAATVLLLDPRKKSTLLLLGWLAAPIGWSVVIGQAQVAVTFLMTLGSPLALAVASHIKVFPALAAIFWIGRRDWPRLARFLAWAGLLLGVSFVLEPAATIAYLSFLSLDQVGQVRSLSPYEISPALWALTVVLLGIVAWKLAPTRYGWAAAVTLSVFATPRLLMYQLMTLLAVAGGPRDRDAQGERASSPS